jgi:chorismate mutase
MTKAVRGAIQVRHNDKRAIYEASQRLVSEVLKANAISLQDIISIIFSQTVDLDAGYPATGLREVGFAETPLFCVQEARVEDSMPRVIRVLVTFEGEAQKKPSAIYMEGAESLRSDIIPGRAR